MTETGSRTPKRLLVTALLLALLLALGVGIRELRRGDATGTGGSPAARPPGATAGPTAPVEPTGEPPEVPSHPVAETPAAEGNGRLSGRVLDRVTGAFIPAAVVTLRNRTTKKSVSATCDGSGAYVLEAPAGEYRIRATAPGYLDLDLEASCRNVQPEPIEATAGFASVYPDDAVTLAPGLAVARDLSLRPGLEIAGVVTDERGFPVKGATVWLDMLFVSDGKGKDRMIQLGGGGAFTVRTDERGRFRLDSLYPRGDVFLKAKAEGFLEHESRLTLAGKSLEVPIGLERGRTVAGTVVDSAGSPVAGARIFVQSSRYPSSCDDTRKPTGPDGRFEVQDLPPASHVLLAWTPGHGAAAVELPAGPVETLKVVLPAATASIRGQVCDAGGKPVTGAEVWIAQLDLEACGGVSLRFSHSFPRGSGHAGKAKILPLSAGIHSDSDIFNVKTDAQGEFEIPGLHLGAGAWLQVGGDSGTLRRITTAEYLRITYDPAANEWKQR